MRPRETRSAIVRLRLPERLIQALDAKAATGALPANRSEAVRQLLEGVLGDERRAIVHLLREMFGASVAEALRDGHLAKLDDVRRRLAGVPDDLVTRSLADLGGRRAPDGRVVPLFPTGKARRDRVANGNASKSGHAKGGRSKNGHAKKRSS